LRVNAGNGDRGPGRLLICADDPSLTPYAGLAIVGELARRTRLVELVDAELGAVRGARAVKARRRGLSPGALVVSVAECQIAGAECFDDLENVRADAAGAGLRAVAQTPSAPTARQLARRFEPGHVRAIERAQARVGERLDRELGRDPSEPVTLDLDATETEVYGRRKQGAARSRTGALAYSSYVVTWAQRGRALTSELKGGNQARICAPESAQMIARAVGLLPHGHGEVSARVDSGFYSAELMSELREQRARFTMSAPRTTTMWRALATIPEPAWAEASEMRGAEVAEVAFTPAGWAHEPLRLIVRRVAVSAAEIRARSPKARRRSTIPADQLQMILDGRLASTYAYSFIVTDIPAEHKTTTEVERFHRRRAQIEERFKDAKLGQPLRHLPSGDLDANRLWLACSLLALNITALVCDLSPAAGASGAAPEDTPLRRHAKALRRILFCVPARVTRSARQTILHLPKGFRHLHVFQATYDAACALAVP
jgi:DDE family transposase